MIFRSQKGFTLIEILVALVLIGLIFATININLDELTPRDRLEKTLYRLESAISFAQNESIFKNSLVRVHFFLDKSPQEYAIEYADDPQFILPKSLFQKDVDEEDRNKDLDTLNRKFHKIKEFNQENQIIPEDIKILGVSSSIHNKLIRESEASIFIYPNGEKDAGIIILSIENQLGWLKFYQFEDEIERQFQILSSNIEDNDTEVEENVKEIFNKWLIE